MSLFAGRPWVRALGWTAVILILLGIPGHSIPDSSLFRYDKVIHAALFLILAILWMQAAESRGVNGIVVVLMSGIIFSVMSEWYQGILPIDRQPDVLDSVADIIGFLAGVLGWGIWTRFVRFGRRKSNF